MPKQRMTPAVLGMLAALAVLIPAAACPAQGFPAVTKPSADAVLSFVRPGLIWQVPVKEGQHVQAGQLLIQQDDRAEQASLALSKMQAEDTTAVDAAKAQLDLAEVDLRRTEDAFKGGAANVAEVDHARLQRDIARLRLQLSQIELDQNKLKHQAERLQVERMKLTSPISGRVENIQVEPGEAADALSPVARVVQTDPLWVDVGVPVAVAKDLKVGQGATVRVDPSQYQIPVDYPPMAGKVLHVGTVADPGSSKLRVRVELANPTGVPAGLNVLVDFPPAEKATTPQARAEYARQDQPKGELNVSQGNPAGER